MFWIMFKDPGFEKDEWGETKWQVDTMAGFERSGRDRADALKKLHPTWEVVLLKEIYTAPR